jgi:hypothetical protein
MATLAAASVLAGSVAAAGEPALTIKRARHAALRDERAAAARLARLGVAGYPGDWEVAGATAGPCHRVSSTVVDCAAHSSLNYFGDLPSEPTPGAKGMRCSDRLRVRLRDHRTRVHPRSSHCHLTQ